MPGSRHESKAAFKVTRPSSEVRPQGSTFPIATPRSSRQTGALGRDRSISGAEGVNRSIDNPYSVGGVELFEEHLSLHAEGEGDE